jgi:2-hydroxy-6-oxonona-2,4-dienedioate hydrolase
VIETETSLYLDLFGSSTRFVCGKQYTTRVIEAGAGDALILIHGVGSTAECFARNVMRLAERFHVYAVDALYHGYSTLEPFDADHRVRRQAEAIIDFMDAEGIARAHIEGESMGAGIAFEMGMRFPDRLERLILNSGNYYIRYSRTFGASGGAAQLMSLSQASVTDLSRETVRRRLEYFVARPERITDEIVELQYRLYSDPKVLESMKRVFGLTASRASLTGWTEDDARSLKAPVLVIWTDRNPIPLEAGQYLASLFPNGRLHVIPDACHWPQWEHPEEHDRAVTDFLMD